MGFPKKLTTFIFKTQENCLAPLINNQKGPCRHYVYVYVSRDDWHWIEYDQTRNWSEISEEGRTSFRWENNVTSRTLQGMLILIFTPWKFFFLLKSFLCFSLQKIWKRKRELYGAVGKNRARGTESYNFFYMALIVFVF